MNRLNPNRPGAAPGVAGGTSGSGRPGRQSRSPGPAFRARLPLVLHRLRTQPLRRLPESLLPLWGAAAWRAGAPECPGTAGLLRRILARLHRWALRRAGILPRPPGIRIAPAAVAAFREFYRAQREPAHGQATVNAGGSR